MMTLLFHSSRTMYVHRKVSGVERLSTEVTGHLASNVSFIFGYNTLNKTFHFSLHFSFLIHKTRGLKISEI